jgi:AraC-like DNA-binding protein
LRGHGVPNARSTALEAPIENVEPAFPFAINRNASAGPGAFRLILVHGGAVRLAQAGAVSLIPAGTLLLLPPGSRSRLLPDAHAEIHCACFGRSLIDPLALNGATDSVVEMLGTTEPTRARLTGRELEGARGIFSVMEREAGARTPGFQGMVRLKLMEAVLLLVRARLGGPSGHESVDDAPGGDAAGSAPAPLRFHPEEAMQYIQAHSADPLSLPELAARYGLNPSYFSRTFSGHAGVPLVEYINRIRIQKSCQLLKRTEAGIVEIAMAVGYNNLSHFNRYFRRIMGQSPREYRLMSKR